MMTKKEIIEYAIDTLQSMKFFVHHGKGYETFKLLDDLATRYCTVESILQSEIIPFKSIEQIEARIKELQELKEEVT